MNDQPIQEAAQAAAAPAVAVSGASTKTAAAAPAAPPVKKAAPTKPVLAKTAAKPAPVTQKPQAAKTGKAKAAEPKTAKTKAKKVKMVRDSFTFPATEHAQLLALKKRVMAMGTEVKKGELVRLGITLVAALADKSLLAALGRIDKLKTGRPKQ